MAIERTYDPFSPHVAAPAKPKQRTTKSTAKPAAAKASKQTAPKKAAQKPQEAPEPVADTSDAEATIAAQLAELDSLREADSD